MENYELEKRDETRLIAFLDFPDNQVSNANRKWNTFNQNLLYEPEDFDWDFDERN